MQRMGFENIGFHRSFIDNKVAAFFLDLMGVVRLCLFTGRHDIILLQYPLKKYFSFICNVAHLKGSQVVALIHDLGSFRRRKLSVRHEINRLSHADYVIASNAAMEQWLHDNGLKRPTGALGLFDYAQHAAAAELRRWNPRPVEGRLRWIAQFPQEQFFSADARHRQKLQSCGLR